MHRIPQRTLLCLLLLTPAAPARAGSPVGFVATVEGRVDVGPADGAWRAARIDTDVSVGDRIRTDLDSSARILFADDTMLQIDEDTELRIESFHVGAAATKERSILRQVRGRVRTQVGRAFGGETRLEVHTPTAVVGVKGTDFQTAAVGRGIWSCCLHSGAILVSGGGGSSAPAPGYCVNVGPDAPPGKPYPNPDAPLVTAKDGVGADGDFAVVVEPGQTVPFAGDFGDEDDVAGGIEVPGLAAAPAQPAPPAPVVPCCAIVAGP